MKIKFEVNMNTKIMYDFLLNHAYRRGSGFFSIFLGIVALMVGVNYARSGDPGQYIIWFVFAGLFIFLTPVRLLGRAKTQVMHPRFKEPIYYEMDEEGVRISQNGEEGMVKWEQIIKVYSTNKSILLYSGKMNAFIIPREAVGENYENMLKLISANIDPANVKIRF